LEYPVSLFKRSEGNWTEKVVKNEVQEKFYRDLGFHGLGEGGLFDPNADPELKRGPGRPPKVA